MATGFTAFERALMFSTGTPRSCATLFRLKSFVMILPPTSCANCRSFESTSAMSSKSASVTSTFMRDSLRIFCRMSRPLRPRTRFRESAESAMCCSSSSTNTGMRSVPSRKPVSQISAIRPSMMTLVSSSLYCRSACTGCTDACAGTRLSRIRDISRRNRGIKSKTAASSSCFFTMM